MRIWQIALPDSRLRRAVKIAAARAGMTIGAWVVQAIKAQLAREKMG